jgi:hypothetical protein
MERFYPARRGNIPSMSTAALRHPLHAVATEAVHLEHIAEEGESGAALLIVFAAVFVFVLALAAALMAVDFSAASLLGG